MLLQIQTVDEIQINDTVDRLLISISMMMQPIGKLAVMNGDEWKN
eukprot:COSAG06_NODE_2821_length_6233_cov_6.865015_6_plen_45_part_00